jgi:hypothetical protein
MGSWYAIEVPAGGRFSREPCPGELVSIVVLYYCM